MVRPPRAGAAGASAVSLASCLARLCACLALLALAPKRSMNELRCAALRAVVAAWAFACSSRAAFWLTYAS